jgi:hypothetical protein
MLASQQPTAYGRSPPQRGGLKRSVRSSIATRRVPKNVEAKMTIGGRRYRAKLGQGSL